MDPQVKLGEVLTTTCKRVGGSPLLQLFKDPGTTLDPWKGDSPTSGHLALHGFPIDWFSAMVGQNVQQCLDLGPQYQNSPRGRLLRLAVKRTPSLTPQCFTLGNLHFRIDSLTGVCTSTWPGEGETLFYRGATGYPSFRDPTDPAKGGSGYAGYDRWAFKRGSGGLGGGCSNFLTGPCGTMSYTSKGNGQVLASGSVVDGTIVGFPANSSFTELVDYVANVTGCCISGATPTVIIDCSYFFCVYPQGGDGPTNNPGA